MRRRGIWVFLSLLLIAAPLTASAQATLPPWRQELPGGRDQATIMVGDTEVTVDLALTSPQQQLGLGYRNGLEPDHGMLFVGHENQMRVFWMKGMRFCLDIIWIQGDTIVGAAESVCPDPAGMADADRARYPSNEPATHVLEMNAGWLADHGYGPGTVLDLGNVPGIGDASGS